MAHYGSLVNAVVGSPPIKPKVGMGVTFCFWSDRSAGTIVEVCSLRRIVVQRDDSKLVGGSCESEMQKYKFMRVPDAPRLVVKKSTDGQWYTEGGKAKGTKIVIGHRDEWRDPSF
jgi:hypothetical protein